MKKYSKIFWILFWSISVVLLAGFYLYLAWQKNPAGFLNSAISLLPINSQSKQDYKALAKLASAIMIRDGRERSYMLLFLNDMELRPGGGYIGTFGVAKIKNGKAQKIETYDLSNFDNRIPNTLKPPYPLKEILGVDFWKLRDSNFSPDFSENAGQAEYFYHLGQGRENFDGIIALNSNVLSSILKISGPVSVDGYPVTFSGEDAILALEYQVEKGYAQQGIAKSERKTIMKDLADVIMGKIFKFNIRQKIDLAETIIANLDEKNIQLNFKNQELQEITEKAGWSGNVNRDWAGNYLMMVDANLGSFKSDYYMKRSFDYMADFSADLPIARVKITYEHTGIAKDWMTKDYMSYLRVYVPKGSQIIEPKNFTDKVITGEEFGKEYFGSVIEIPLNEKKTFEFNYSLPNNVSENYKLLIQKQSGIGQLPGHVTIIEKDGFRRDFDVKLLSDKVI